MHLYDTFTGIPPPTAKDGEDAHKRYAEIKSGKAGKDYYGYMKNLLGYDTQQFEEAGISPQPNGVEFHQGLFNETLEVPTVTWPVAYAHLDGAFYESTMTVLERVTPKLSLNGS